MKSMLMAVMAVAVAVTFSAPAFAGDKPKEEKKGGYVVVSAEEKKDAESGKADEIFAGKPSDERPKPRPGK
jgi:hypothetical protein